MSAVLPEGRLVEMIFDPVEQRTRFVLWQNGGWRFESVVRALAGERLIPYSAHNNLIKKEVVLFPSEPCDYGSEADLVRDIQSFIYRYVDVSPRFERIASYYVLFSWLYDGFAELPYSRRDVRHRFAADGATTKFRIAKAIAKELPELAPRLQAARKIWLPEHANMSIFDAASLALTRFAEIAQEASSEVERAA